MISVAHYQMCNMIKQEAKLLFWDAMLFVILFMQVLFCVKGCGMH